MNKHISVIALAATMVAAVLYGCSKPSSGGATANETNKDFKIGMLGNYADNIIVPGYTDLQQKLTTMETSVNSFLAAPSSTSQQSLKASFKAAYLSYQATSVANFGPGASLLLNGYLNSFPSTTDKIENGIQTGTYNFNQPISSDSIQGFPALDYLLFSGNAIQKFSETNSANRKKYVQDIVAKMKGLVDNALTQWKGVYKTTFTNSIQTNVGSSIGYLVNQFAFELDALKGPRIGWPMGKKSNGIVFADKCEGYYAGISAALAVKNLTSLKNYYTGGSGNGMDDYLIKLGKTGLNTELLAQFETVLTALTAIPDPMSDAFTNNTTVMDNAYKEIQKLLTLIKTDLASATAVQVTYLDNDGD